MLQRVIGCYKGLQEVTRGYWWVHRFTMGYWGYKGLQGVTKGYNG